MSTELPLSKERKLTVVFRVEAGCLGPDGEKHVENFCQFAQKEVELIHPDFVHWLIVPRHDKEQIETEYSVNNKKLTHEQADRYLSVFEKSLDEFEEHFNDVMIVLIEEYLV